MATSSDVAAKWQTIFPSTANYALIDSLPSVQHKTLIHMNADMARRLTKSMARIRNCGASQNAVNYTQAGTFGKRGNIRLPQAQCISHFQVKALKLSNSQDRLLPAANCISFLIQPHILPSHRTLLAPEKALPSKSIQAIRPLPYANKAQTYSVKMLNDTHRCLWHLISVEYDAKRPSRIIKAGMPLPASSQDSALPDKRTMSPCTLP